jgi:hypothetical protein
MRKFVYDEDFCLSIWLDNEFFFRQIPGLQKRSIIEIDNFFNTVLLDVNLTDSCHRVFAMQLLP